MADGVARLARKMALGRTATQLGGGGGIIGIKTRGGGGMVGIKGRQGVHRTVRGSGFGGGRRRPIPGGSGGRTYA